MPVYTTEFLPVSIIDHKGRVAPDEYFIMHSLGLIECIDIKKSKVTWNPLDKTIIMSSKGLFIDETKIPTSSKIFCPLHWGSETLIQSEFSEELESAGFTGLHFRPANGYTGIG